MTDSWSLACCFDSGLPDLRNKMNPYTNVFCFSAKKRRLLLPGETRFAALVFGNTPSQVISSRELLLDQVWDAVFLRAAAVTEPEPEVKETELTAEMTIMPS